MVRAMHTVGALYRSIDGSYTSFNFFYCICIYFVGVHGPTAHVWRSDDNICGSAWTNYMHVRSDDNIQESVLSFHHVCPGNQTQMSRRGSKHLYPLGHLTGPDD